MAIVTQKTATGSVRLPGVGLLPLVVLVVVSCTGGSTGTDPWFSDEAEARGIDFRHQSGFAGRPLLPEITGSGGALVDVDGDGDLDAYLVQAGSLYADAAATAPGNKLYLNESGRFVLAPDAHGANDRGYGMGVAAADYDDDGDIDLYVTNVGPNVLYRNNGNNGNDGNDGSGHFEDVTAAAGVGDPGWSTSATFADFDLDGDLDLFYTNYIHWSHAVEMNCYSGSVLTYCPPMNYNAPARDRLYRNNGDGTFSDVSEASGISRVFGNGFGVVARDFNNDGLPDIFIANDQMVDQLWLNQGDLRFDEVANLWGSAVDEHGVAKAGMGVAAADVDQDGDMDVVVTNITGQTDSFFRNEGGFFTDATGELGLALTGRYTRWGIVMADFDNDGLLDLYEVNGMVGTEALTKGLDFDEPNVLYRGTSAGRFEEVLPQGGVAPPLLHTSRGVAMGDVDGDGGIDLLVVNRDGPAYLLMNRAAAGTNWIRFRVRLAARPRDAHGATVSALVGDRRRYAVVQPDGSYLSSSEPVVHFGLGDATRVSDVQVRWPGSPAGETESFGTFEAGQTAVLQQGQGTGGAD